MKNKKGFTLIELIAVIAILTIIALIAVPVINSMLKETKKNAFEDTAYGLVKAGEQYYAQKGMLGDNFKEITFEFPDKIEGLETTGELPKSGYMTIDKDGYITLAVSNGKYCVTKENKETKVKVTKDLENCGLSNDVDDSESTPKTLSQLATTSTELGVNSVNACATNGTCKPGTAFAIKVNKTTTEKFYVTNDDGNTVSLILNRNLPSEENTNPNVSWLSQEDYKNAVPNNVLDSVNNEILGPITALRALKGRTSKWTNIAPYSYRLAYGDVDVTGKIEVGYYSGEYVQNVRARLPEPSDLIGCEFWDATCPEWLYENLHNVANGNVGYWISYGLCNDFSFIDIPIVTYDGYYYYDAYGAGSYGIRPVIELKK